MTVLDEILRTQGYEPDFTEGRAWRKDDVQYIDIDLSVARPKPVALGLAGKKVFVSLIAWDSRYVESAVKTVGKANIVLNEPNGNPIELGAGMYYDFGGAFNDVFIRNLAQAGAMMRIITSVDTNIQPFSGEIKVVGGVSSAFNDAGDVAIAAGAAAAIFMAANPLRLDCLIKNIGVNDCRVGNAPTATRGYLLGAGESMSIAGKGQIRVFSTLGTTLTRLWSEV